MNSQSNQDVREQQYDASAFCSTKEAADMLGVSHRTVQLWVESNVLQAWKTAGGHRRITIESVQRVVAQRSQAMRQPVSALPAQGGRKVLIVDDDATLLRLYELEMTGWKPDLQIRKASNGFDALIRIGESRPDLLISDLSMPGMDGFRMIRTLRADQTYGKMAIIVISGLDRTTIRSMGLPDDIAVFGKPVSFIELEKTVNQVLQRAA